MLTACSSIALVVAAPRAIAERCPPAAVVEGEARLSGRVRAAVAARGVATSASPGCAPIHARVASAGDAIRVELSDGVGHSVSRDVASVGIAATIIESWARPELYEALLERPPEPEPPAAEVHVTAVPIAEPAAAPAPRHPMLAATAEGSLGSDGSVWAGARVLGCAWVGPVCAGIALRFADDGGLTGDTGHAGGGRLGADMLIAVDLPSRARGFVLTPGIAAGVGWIRAHGFEPDGDRVELDWQGPRVEADLAVAAPLTGGLWLYAGASATVLPGAQTAIQDRDNARVAAEPRGFVRLGIGISLAGGP